MAFDALLLLWRASSYPIEASQFVQWAVYEGYAGSDAENLQEIANDWRSLRKFCAVAALTLREACDGFSPEPTSARQPAAF